MYKKYHVSTACHIHCTHCSQCTRNMYTYIFSIYIYIYINEQTVCLLTHVLYYQVYMHTYTTYSAEYMIWLASTTHAYRTDVAFRQNPPIVYPPPIATHTHTDTRTHNNQQQNQQSCNKHTHIFHSPVLQLLRASQDLNQFGKDGAKLSLIF